jgi:hypothetical protein
MDLDRMSMEELHGILIDYEMRTEKDNIFSNKEAFKATKKTKKKYKQNPKSYYSCNNDSEEDEEVENI